MPKINQKTVNAVPLPLPSREEQGNVVRSVKAALDTADRVGKAISVAETALGGSVRGALAKAFRGELVPSETEPSVAASWIR
jgi:type I restriction enzyme S subunit